MPLCHQRLFVEFAIQYYILYTIYTKLYNRSLTLSIILITEHFPLLNLVRLSL